MIVIYFDIYTELKDYIYIPMYLLLLVTVIF